MKSLTHGIESNSTFQTHLTDWYHAYFLVNSYWMPQITHLWCVDIGSGTGLVLSGIKPLPGPLLTQILCCHIQRNLYNKIWEVLLKTQKFQHLSGTVLTKSFLFSLSWQTTCLERPQNLVVALYRFYCCITRLQLEAGWCIYVAVNRVIIGSDNQRSPKSKILGHPMDYPWWMAGWSMLPLGDPYI